jgi:hypothetical protein
MGKGFWDLLFTWSEDDDPPAPVDWSTVTGSLRTASGESGEERLHASGRLQQRGSSSSTRRVGSTATQKNTPHTQQRRSHPQSIDIPGSPASKEEHLFVPMPSRQKKQGQRRGRTSGVKAKANDAIASESTVESWLRLDWEEDF